MKYFVASDLHGSSDAIMKMLNRFKIEEADRILLLGDLLYHGPRNALPCGYDTKESAELLNAYKEKISCVRGNCDADVDQVMLEFKITDTYREFTSGNLKIFATHGHTYNEGNIPPVDFDVLLHGHTHIPACIEHDGYVYCNPGSTSIPKGGSEPSYMIIEDGVITFKTLDGKVTGTYSKK